MHDLIRENSSKLELSMRLVDAWIVLGAGRLAALLHFGRPLEATDPVHTLLLYFCGALAFVLFAKADLYGSLRGRPLVSLCRRVVLTWASVVLTGLFVSFLAHRAAGLSRLWLLYWYVGALLPLLAFRWVVYAALNLLRRHGFNTKNVVIVGYGETGRAIHRSAVAYDWSGYAIRAVCPLDGSTAKPACQPVDLIAEPGALPDYLASRDIHEVWIALPLHHSHQLQQLQQLLGDTMVDVRWIPDVHQLQLLSHKVGDFLGFPAVDLNQPASSGLQGLAKDAFDRLFAACVLLLLSPLMLGIAVAIKLTSPGPVLFRQARHGLNGRTFQVYKFRSMSLHASSTFVQATFHDPRVTRVGGFLRRTSLDELPQFLNVLLGEMSVVGPRPHALQHNDQYRKVLDRYMLRHRVKPGITGWAQIHGHRGETDTIEKMATRVQFDMYYIRNWSLWLDCRIIAWTTWKGWTGKNAY
jgi:putative colanic acid biosynthesis UDP-glucose lipid carrier transferase